MQQLNLYQRTLPQHGCDLSFLDVAIAQNVARFHAGFPQYRPTPLHSLEHLAQHLRVGQVLVKDELARFGLNAFKVLGSSHAAGNLVADRLGIRLEDLTFQQMVSPQTKATLGSLTLVTATDGNHGRGVAWTANQLGQRSIVYMPAGSSKERADNIAREGAEVSILDCNYDECVRRADQLANESGYVLVQDTAWDGYEDIPRWIMQGYLTMAWETLNQMDRMLVRPTHVFLQAGVGSMAAAMTGFFSRAFPGEQAPIFTVVEPAAVDCVYRSAAAGRRTLVGGLHDTIMSGLACGEPNTLALQVLMDHAQNYLSIPDPLAAYGMRVLGHPLGDDARIISGESGAAPLGAAAAILTDPSLSAVKQALGLQEDSVLLLFSTEGDTDRQDYLDIVWKGRYPNG